MMEAAGSESSLDLDNLKLLEVSTHHGASNGQPIIGWSIYHFKQSQFFVFQMCMTDYTLKCCVLQESPHTKKRLEKDKGKSKGKIRRPK